MAFFKPQSPLNVNGNGIYPLTTYDQIVLQDGSRWDGKTFLTNILAYSKTINLPVQNWTDEAPYIQSIEFPGLEEDDLVNMDISMKEATVSTASTIPENWGYVGRSLAEKNLITFFCYESKPEIDLTVNVQVVRQSPDRVTYAEEADF